MERQVITQLLFWQQKRNRKPLLLLGARQVGKTYLLRRFGEKHFPVFHYFDFEEQKPAIREIFEGASLTPREIVNKLSFLSGKTIDLKRDLLILDEIQAVPRAVTALKYFYQDMPELAVAAAGSNLGVAMSSEPFPVGKVECIHVFPLTFAEFLAGTDEKPALNFLKEFNGEPTDDFYHQRLFELLKRYFITGGLPEVIKEYAALKDNPSVAFKAARNLQQQLIYHYESDFSKYSGSTNSRHIGRIFRTIPSQLSRMQDKKAKKFIFKDVISKGFRSYEDLADPIEWLVKAGLAIKLPMNPHPSIPLRAGIIENNFKLFLFDVGLLGSMNNLPPEKIMLYDYGSYKGYFAENFVLQELHALGIRDIVTWAGRTSEIECIAEIDSAVIPVEVKAGVNTKAKSLQAYIKKYSPLFSVKFTGNKFGLDNRQSIYNYPLYMISNFPRLSRRETEQ